MPPTQTTSMYQQIIAFNWEKLDYFYGDDRKARLFLWVIFSAAFCAASSQAWNMAAHAVLVASYAEFGAGTSTHDSCEQQD